MIADRFGVQWQISDTGAVVAGETVDADPAPVLQLVFVDGLIWRQTRDQRWSCKRHHTDHWGTPTGEPTTEFSPVPGQAGTGSAQIIDEVDTTTSNITNQFEFGNRAVLAAIATFRAEFDVWKAKPQPSPTPTEIMQAIDNLEADLDLRANAIAVVSISNQSALSSAVTAASSNQTTLIGLLDQILDAQSVNQMATTAALNQIIADAAGTSAAMLAKISTILDNVQQILAIVKSEEPAPATRLTSDLSHATHTTQSVPSTKPKPEPHT